LGALTFFLRSVTPANANKREGFRMASALPDFTRLTNPIDLTEQIASINDWPFERSADDELTVAIAGTWSDYHLSLNWRDDLESLHIACAFDLKVPMSRTAEVYRLLAQINEQLWIGHFDLWAHDGVLLYRHSLMLHGAEPTPGQCEAMLQAALESCERYYQAFQFVVWAGKRAEDAIATAMFDTEGQA
jgi:hypothetical protein